MPFAGLLENSDAPPEPYSVAPWSLSARHLSTLRARAIQPLLQFSFQSVASIAAMPKKVNMAVAQAYPKRAKHRVLPGPDDGQRWRGGQTIIPKGAERKLNANWTVPAIRIVNESRPLHRSPKKRDYRQDLDFETQVIPAQGLRSAARNTTLALHWQVPAQVQRDNISPWQNFARTDRAEYSFVPELPWKGEIAHAGGTYVWAMNALGLPFKMRESFGSPAKSGGNLHIPGVHLETSAELPQYQQPLVVYGQAESAPLLPFRDGIGPQKMVRSAQHPQSPAFAGEKIEAQGLGQSTRQAVSIQPDLISSVRLLREAQQPRLPTDAGHPEVPRSLGLKFSEPFSALQSYRELPPLIETVAANKNVSYLRHGVATEAIDFAGPALREGSHKPSDVHPDLIPSPTATHESRQARIAEEFPNLDRYAGAGWNSDGQFSQIQNRMAQPPMVARSTPLDFARPPVLHAGGVPDSAAHDGLGMEASGQSARMQEQMTQLPGLAQSSTFDTLRLPVLGESESSLPELDLRAEIPLPAESSFSAFHNRMAQPPMVARSTHFDFLRSPALQEDGVPDSAAHTGVRLETHGRFLRTQEQMAQLPGLAQSSAFDTLRSPVLRNTESSLPNLDLSAKIHFPSGGSFSHFHNRTAQPPMFAVSRTFDYRRPPAILAGIPSSLPKLTGAGAVGLTLRQRPPIRESDLHPMPLVSGSTALPAVTLEITVDAKTVVFAYSTRLAPAEMLVEKRGIGQGRLANHTWASLSRPVRGSAGIADEASAVPVQSNFATLPKPYDSDTPHTAEVLRERIFSPIVRSHLILSKANLELKNPALDWERDLAALDFRFRRNKNLWDRTGRWKLKAGGKLAELSPLPNVDQDGFGL